MRALCSIYSCPPQSRSTRDSSSFDSRVRFAVNVRVGGEGAGGRGVGAAEVLVGDPPRLPQPGQQGPVHRRRVVPDRVLPAEEDPRRVLDHVVALARVAGYDRGSQDVVVVTRRAYNTTSLIIIQKYLVKIMNFVKKITKNKK